MAFNVTPTSGATPYLFTADFENKDNFSLGNFTLYAYAISGEGVCPAPSFGGSGLPDMSQSLLNDGSYTMSSGSVPVGSCRVFNLVIKDISGVVIDNKTVAIDNN